MLFAQWLAETDMKIHRDIQEEKEEKILYIH